MSEREFQSSSESSDEEGWLDANPEDDEEPQAVISLLDARVFPDAASMIAYCKEEHGFDFLAIRDRLALDFYGSVKLINFSESVCDRPEDHEASSRKYPNCVL